MRLRWSAPWLHSGLKEADMDQIYRWKRFLLKVDSREPILEEGAYLPDPETSGALWTSDVVSLEELGSVPCVVVLGEPGTGKSQALRNEKQRIDTTQSENTLHARLALLEEFADGADLRQNVFECIEWKAWSAGQGIFHLLLDSLDEVKIEVETACSIIGESLKTADAKRLRLRVCCRTFDWPEYFEKELRGLWLSEDSEALQVYRLLPLRRGDIIEALQTDGLDADDFMSQVRDRELQPFAAKPITLLALMDDFSKDGVLPQSKWDIYESLCLRLCDEPNPRYKDRPKLKAKTAVSAKRRFEVASAIAGTMMLCAKSSVCMFDDGKEVKDRVLSVVDLVAENGRGIFSNSELDETLRTALFRHTARERFVFEHKTYLEFLAANYLRSLPFRRLRRFLTVGNSSIPEFRELAGWSADKCVPLRRWLIRHDPVSMVHGDLSSLDDSERSMLVESLLAQLDRLEHIHSVSLWDKGAKLKHATIARQLEPYLTDVSKEWPVRTATCEIIRGCALRELEPMLVDMVTNDSESAIVRRYACHALETTASTDTKQALRNYLVEYSEEMEYGLKGSLLGILWPGSLNIDEVLPMLTASRDDQVAHDYHVFIFEFAESLKISDIPLVLNHFTAHEGSDGISDYSFQKMLDRVFLRAVENLPSPGMRTAVGEYAMVRRTRGGEVVGGDEEPRLQSLLDEDANLRREFARGILESWPVQGVPSHVFQLCLKEHTRLDDYSWLLGTAAAFPWQTKILVLEVLSWYVVGGTEMGITSNHVDCFCQAVEASEAEVREHFSWLKGRPLDCDEAEQHRKWHALTQEQHRKREEREYAKPKAEDIIAGELPKALRGEAEAWYRVCVATCCEGERIEQNWLSDKHFLSESKRWRDMNDATQARVGEAALAFLRANVPTDHSWLSEGSKTGLIVAGQMAIAVVGESEAALDQISPDILKAWIPTVVGFWGTPDAGFRNVIKRAYSQHPTEFLKCLTIVLDRQNKGGDAREIAEELHVILDYGLRQYLIARMQRDDCHPVVLGHLTSVLIQSCPDVVAETVVSKFTGASSGDKETQKVCIRAFQLVLRHWSLKYWDRVEQWLCEAPEVCYRALCGFGYRYLHKEHDPLASLELWQVAKLYTWMRNHRHANRKPTQDERASERDDWAYQVIDNYFMGRLVTLGTPEAIRLLKTIRRDLKDEHADFITYQIHRAQEELVAKSWIPLTPREVFRLHIAERERLPIFKTVLLAVVLTGVVAFRLWTSGSGFWKHVDVWLVFFVSFCLYYYHLTPDQKRRVQNLKKEFSGWQG